MPCGARSRLKSLRVKLAMQLTAHWLHNWAQSWLHCGLHSWLHSCLRPPPCLLRSSLRKDVRTLHTEAAEMTAPLLPPSRSSGIQRFSVEKTQHTIRKSNRKYVYIICGTTDCSENCGGSQALEHFIESSTAQLAAQLAAQPALASTNRSRICTSHRIGHPVHCFKPCGPD